MKSEAEDKSRGCDKPAIWLKTERNSRLELGPQGEPLGNAVAGFYRPKQQCQSTDDK